VFPTKIVEEDNDPVIVSPLTGLTVRGSQGEVAPLLLASPEYAAWKL